MQFGTGVALHMGKSKITRQDGWLTVKVGQLLRADHRIVGPRLRLDLQDKNDWDVITSECQSSCLDHQ